MPSNVEIIFAMPEDQSERWLLRGLSTFQFSNPLCSFVSFVVNS
jgi:hypothetical protein